MVMPMGLDSWQTLLSEHFGELHQRRTRSGLDKPVFALEHGLDSSQLEAIASYVRNDVVDGPLSREFPLPWIIYAAEIGYRYSGDEYWQTFAQTTPGWEFYGDRYWVRDSFRSFQAQFNGALPSGAWANHFSIICWPITHAILPCDLQRQLARILYEVRHSFSADLLDCPSALGEFIAARSWNATSRFQNLCQEPRLVGQIAAALLLQSATDEDTLIYPATLKRIGEDLERERRAREWLRSARRFAQERASVRGLSLRRGTPPSFVGRPEQARREAVALGIEPRLVLRPSATYPVSWDVELEIPDLSHLLLRFPSAREILTGARCTVAGKSGRPLARGRLLHGAQRVRLSRWPRPSEVLLQFEQSDAQLDYLLRTECLLRPGPLWLFRIASDGLAYESRGLRARAGQRYVLISNSAPIVSGISTQPVDLTCDGAHAALLELPDALTAAWEDALRNIGIRQARTIEVWPSGLAAAVWDGDGHGEWLASERPCLGIQTDHPLDALILTLKTDSDDSLVLSPVVPGQPMFIELPQLPIGLHTVSVSNRRNPSSEAEPLGELDVLIRIREARPWSPGVTSQGPLVLQLDPPAPTLEQLWQGEIDVTVLGPTMRHVKCQVSFFENENDHPVFVQELQRIPLPMLSDHWRHTFEQHVRSSEKAQTAYDTARLCEIAFTAHELGAFTIRCERQFTPVRWSLRPDNAGYIARLIDDSGDEAAPQVIRRAFETPFAAESLPLATEYRVPVAGGMYVARLQNLTAAIVAPPTVSGLGDLRCIPQVEPAPRSLDSVTRAIALADLWASARVPGALFARTRQQDVLYALLLHIHRLLCGDNWARAEATLGDPSDGLVRLQDAISRRRDEVAVGIVLARDCTDLTHSKSQDRIDRIASIAMRFLSISDADEAHWLAQLALRLASAPAAVQTWAGPRLRDGVMRLMELPTLARAARYLVLATDRHLGSRTAPGELYASWQW